MRAKIAKFDGVSSVVINDSISAPMAFTSMNLEKCRDGYLKQLGDSGIKLHYLLTSLIWNRNVVLEKLHDNLNLLCSSVPDAYVVLRVNLEPPAEWVNSHPEEQIVYSDGLHRPVYNGQYDGMFSMCSEKWRYATDIELRKFLGAVSSLPYFERVVGVFLCAGGTGEWYYPCIMREGDVTSDYSISFKKEYSSFLRKKYGTVDLLKKSWKRDDASFDDPYIPPADERRHIDLVEEQIIRHIYLWENFEYVAPKDEFGNDKPPPNIGVFLNACDYMATADYYDALHESTANTIIHFAETVKNMFPDLLVGTFYGYFGCTDFYEASHTGGILKLLNSDYVDIIASPGTYNNREPGGSVTQRVMFDSFNLHGKVFFCEEDTRTHRVKLNIQRAGEKIYNLSDSINILKRDFARNICDNTYAWWFDMENNWYDEPEILELFRRQEEISEYFYSDSRRKKNDIAIIYDVDSIHVASQGLNKLVLDFYRTSEFSRLGTGADFYFHDDMSCADMPDYRVYIMVNQYCLTDAERECIYYKARKNHATVVWLYAPGFVNRSSPSVMCKENIEKTVGMCLEMSTELEFPYFNIVENSHPIVAYADKYRKYGFIDRNVQSNVWLSSTVLQPPFVMPYFQISEDEDIVVLGRYCDGGAPAMALRELDGFTSVYCAVPVIRNDLIRSVATWSGCHIYSYSDDVLYANEKFIAIHASSAGRKVLNLKKKCSVYEVYDRSYYGCETDTLELEMYPGETKMFLLDGMC